jgi:hypothetical protein
VGTVYRVAYANLDSPPPQSLLHFDERGKNVVYLKAGQRFSVVLFENGLWRKRLAVRWLVNHEVAECWQVSNRGLPVAAGL